MNITNIYNGVDIVKIDRFENINDLFLENNFTTNELNYIKSKNNNLETIAGIYAAKEATLKSLGLSLDGLPLKDIEINHNNGCPFITLNNKEFSHYNFSVSISHEDKFAIAFVIRY